MALRGDVQHSDLATVCRAKATGAVHPCGLGGVARVTCVGDVLDALERAPMRDLDVLVGARPVLVLAPHPDDESLACGGLIAAATARGQGVFVAILTDGSQSHPDAPSHPPSRLKALREAEVRAAVKELGVAADNLLLLAQPDGRAPHEGSRFDALLERLTRWARERHVCTVVTTWEHDPHTDHFAASVLAGALCRRIGARHLACPVWGWTLERGRELPGPPPRAARLDITHCLDAKRRAVAAHRSQTTNLIHDAPNAFRLAPEFLALFDRPWEVFIDV